MSARNRDFVKKLIAWAIIVTMLMSTVVFLIIVIMQQAQLGM